MTGEPAIRASSGEPPAPHRPAAPGPDDAPGEQVPRVLIVEDEFFTAWHLGTIIEGMQLEVCAMAANGAEAVAQAAALAPDVVLMDINLAGGIDGIEATRRILAERHVPVIFITAYSHPAVLDQIAAEVGPVPVLAKPVMPARLEAAIRGALGRPKR